MDVVPLRMGYASRGWDELHLDLAAATRQIRGASTAGFTAPVSGVASRFTASWERFTHSLGGECETRADGLRAAVGDYLGTDAVQGMQLLQLQTFLGEER